MATSASVPIDYVRARRLLARRDPVLRELMRVHGPCRLAARQHADPFKALTRAIVGQQLSAKAAATIFSRFEALFEAFPTPAQVSAVPDDRLRGVGLSSQKVGYLRDLCRRILDGELPLDVLDRMDDEAVVETLMQVKGIGRWTAEMFLIFRLQRPDVLPLGDLGVRKGFARAFSRRVLRDPMVLSRRAERWRPYRSVASWYLWRALDLERA